MNPWRDIGAPELLELAGNRPAPVIGLIDGPVDASHPVLAHTRVRSADREDPSCTNLDSPACAHGTFVAGQLARRAPSSEIVTHSLFCEASSLQACPVVGPRHLAVAIDGLVDHGARIINMSVGLQGGPVGSMSSLRRAYRRARQHGVLLVAAAGNDGSHDVNPLFRDEWVIPVAAHDQAGAILPTSNRGGLVASQGLMTLGEGVSGLAPAGGDTRMSGTSVAAPAVSAAVALLWALHPEATAEQVRDALLRPDHERSGDVPPRLDLVESHAWLERLHEPKSPIHVRSTMTEFSPSQEADSSDAAQGVPEVPTTPTTRAEAAVVPQACSCSPGAALGWVFSTGKVEVRFPDQGVKQEFDSRANGNPKPFSVLSDPSNRYLARQVCWVLEVAHAPAGILVPRGEADLTDLIASLGEGGRLVVAVTGTLGDTAPASKCDGLRVPMVGLAELNYFTTEKLLERLEKLPGIDPRALASAAQQIWTLSGTFREPGFDDEQRAMNFVVLRTTAIYRKTIELDQQSNPSWLQTITATSSRSEAGRSLVNVDSTFQNAQGQVQTWREEIDVTDLFAFSSRALFQV